MFSLILTIITSLPLLTKTPQVITPVPSNLKVNAPLLHNHDTTNYMYTYTCGNIINNIDERTHFFKKIYLSHFILETVAKGLCVRGELETATYWPQVPLTRAALLSHSAGLFNRGSLRAASPLSGAGSHCLEMQLELQLQLTPTNSSHLRHLVI